MIARSTTLLSALIAIVVLATGCGDGEGSSSASGTEQETLTKAQFVKRAEAICSRERNTSSRISHNISKFTKPGRNPTEQFAFTLKAVLLARIKIENEALRELGAPPGDEERIMAFLDAQRKALETVKGLPAPTGVYDAKRIFAKPDRMAKQYGLESCQNARAFGGYEG